MTQRKLTIPVSSETYDLLQQIAYEQGQSLAAFCRDRIMAKENLNEAFNALQKTLISTIHDAGNRPSVAANQGEASAHVHAMVAEVLLLLRSLVPPQKVQVVHSELRRTGVEPAITG